MSKAAGQGQRESARVVQRLASRGFFRPEGSGDAAEIELPSPQQSQAKDVAEIVEGLNASLDDIWSAQVKGCNSNPVALAASSVVGDDITTHKAGVDEIRQQTARYTHKLPNFSKENLEDIKQCRIGAGSFDLYVYTNDKLNFSSDWPTTFYIPGTASVNKNIEVSQINACFCLSNTPRRNVVLVSHRTAPDNKWPIPLTDCYDAIISYCQKYAPTSIRLVGYSTSGLFALLTALKLKKELPPIEELRLIAPMLDFTGEFNEIQEEGDNAGASLHAEHMHKIGIEPLDWASHCERAKQDTLLNQDFVKNVINHDCFDEHAKNYPAVLRHYSPVFYSSEIYERLRDVPITLISGTNDYFTVGHHIFAQKSQILDLDFKMLMFDGCDHPLGWKSVLPFQLERSWLKKDLITIDKEQYDEYLEQIPGIAEKIKSYLEGEQPCSIVVDCIEQLRQAAHEVIMHCAPARSASCAF